MEFGISVDHERSKPQLPCRRARTMVAMIDSDVAIVGAGIAGLSAAWRLQRQGLRVDVFEREPEFGGRATARRRGDVVYDIGAQFFETSNRASQHLINSVLPTDELVAIPGHLATFSSLDKSVRPGEANSTARWTYRSGIGKLSRLLVETSPASIVHMATPVLRLVVRGDGFHLDVGQSLAATSKAVLFAAPPPALLPVIENSEFDVNCASSWAALRQSRYRSIVAVVLGFQYEIEHPTGAYALINEDRAHPIVWMAFEESKVGHVPSGQSVLILHMSADWSRAHFDEPDDELATKALACASDILSQPIEPSWFDVARWRWALTDAPMSTRDLIPLQNHGVFFAGDAFAKSSIDAAIESGVTIAERIVNFVDGGRSSVDEG
jgi:renalase